MRSLEHAKTRARATRRELGESNQGLLARLRARLETVYQLELIPVPASVIEGSRAEVAPREGVIHYDERFAQKPQELLWVLAHELGHLVLHARLYGDAPDPLAGSAYLSDGAAGLARYSRKAREEAEANAFANELLCPAQAIFAAWQANPQATTQTLAAAWELPERLVRVQLAEALFHCLAPVHESHQPDRERERRRDGETERRSQSDKPTQGGERDASSASGARDTSTDAQLALLSDAVPLWQPGPATSQSTTTKKPVRVNERQNAAATHLGSPALVTAGPGTGKTATLIRRIEFLLGEHGARPEQLLVLTFSNDATDELRERVAARFGETLAAQIEIATFHGFGMSFLHSFGLDVNEDSVILDDAGQEEIISSFIAALPCETLINLRDLEDSVRRLARHINFLKDRSWRDQPLSPALLAQAIDEWEASDESLHTTKPATNAPALQQARELCAVFAQYEQVKRERGALDFADLIAEPIRVLRAKPELQAKLRAKYRWVMVDEYQDVSRVVALLLQLLSGAENPPWVVGDMRQAIYRFRGAAPENVRDFQRDFPAAKIFELDINYRSCPEVVTAANQLAALLSETETPLFAANHLDAGEAEREENAAPRAQTVWQAGSKLTALTEPAIAVARVNSDAAEATGIAAQVREWLAAGIAAGDIAILARRNLDVRNIVLALGAHGIRATTSGLLTAEGAAGDLAAVVTLLDEWRASLPRVAYALGRDRFSAAQLDALINEWLSDAAPLATFGGLSATLARALANDAQPAASDEQSASGLRAELEACAAELAHEYHAADAFTLLCAFLFNASAYLRRVLADDDEARRALNLSEIITTLARAASYRYAHADVEPMAARIGFAQHFRAKLSGSAPSLDVPQGSGDAVRVMTCHASKGLEFPCVIVAGQTLAQGREQWWLPPALQPSALEESAQADSLLFVGVTRAQRALVVSYADSKSGGERARARATTQLLEDWQAQYDVARFDWPTRVTTSETVAHAALWGGAAAARGVAARALDEKACGTKTYLEDFVRLRFPVLAPPQYPSFHFALRLTFEAIVKTAQAERQPVSAAAATELFRAHFPAEKFGEHPHFGIYERFGIRYAQRFAASYAPAHTAYEFLTPRLDPADLLHVTAATNNANAKSDANSANYSADDVQTNAGLLALRLDLVTLYRANDGTHALLFRPESLAADAAKDAPDELLWSGLDTTQRAAFLLLKDLYADLRPAVFSATDGLIYRYRWSSRAAGTATERQRLYDRWHALGQRRFTAKPNDHACNRCPVRLICPHWLRQSGE